uniref:Orf322 n=1 Tax=Tolypocladium ophioglossoides TaxID=71617 RepID=A0A1C9U8C2_9HYPO|nr:orf322 [Tolypocladium ophioglossoides]AOR52829.1 orf322 [Tolypocladium ophioglossoides]
MNHLALPLKTAICWKLLTITLLGYIIYSVKMYNFEQSAGNQRIILVGTSETKRGRHTLNMVRYSPCNLKLIQSYNFIYNPQNTTRFYSTSNVENNTKGLYPLKTYKNFKENRLDILKEQKDKSGVYCLINKINGNSYIGSSINLASRMKNYLNTTFLKSKQNINMPIVKALLKYNQESFTLLILEYVKPNYLTIRETYYITHVMPHYNVLKQGYSSLGYKHTEETKKLLSELAKNRTHTEKSKGLIARALIGENNPFYNKSHSLESKVRIIEAKSAYPVYVYNSYKELLVIFPSVSTLAKLIKSNHPTIVDAIKEQTIFRGEWYFTNLPYNINNIPLISNWTSKECEKLILDINDNSHIRKAVFVYDSNKNFICKYEGVTKAQEALNINHSIIKKHARLSSIYDGYIFSYERLLNLDS